jgi:hypothetical protein
VTGGWWARPEGAESIGRQRKKKGDTAKVRKTTGWVRGSKNAILIIFPNRITFVAILVFNVILEKKIFLSYRPLDRHTSMPVFHLPLGPIVSFRNT